MTAQFLLIPLTPTLPLPFFTAHLLLFPFLTDVNLLSYSSELTQNSQTQLLRVTRLGRGVFSSISPSRCTSSTNRLSRKGMQSFLILRRHLGFRLQQPSITSRTFRLVRNKNCMHSKNLRGIVYVIRRNTINEGIEMKSQTYTAKTSMRMEPKAKA